MLLFPVSGWTISELHFPTIKIIGRQCSFSLLKRAIKSTEATNIQETYIYVLLNDHKNHGETCHFNLLHLRAPWWLWGPKQPCNYFVPRASFGALWSTTCGCYSYCWEFSTVCVFFWSLCFIFHINEANFAHRKFIFYVIFFMYVHVAPCLIPGVKTMFPIQTQVELISFTAADILDLSNTGVTNNIFNCCVALH